MSTALAGCCGSVECACNDRLDDALVFRFNVDGVNDPTKSFPLTQLDTVFIRRVPIDTAQRPRADTVAITGRAGYVTTFTINNNTPFLQNSSRKLDQYDYTIYLGNRRRPTQQFVIDTVRVVDDFAGSGCCTCNRNLDKFIRLDGRDYNLTDPAGDDQTVEVVLNSKP
ncbi:hypothetical protein [Hymenobacter norwichensis]|uniref:hypothetical protein n=1 Tax=Hymenobacter norwichensis TaxID=223903 RepID=UPI0012F7D2A1|nr:hypothetical protein [Hymenobacter norwichensis]